MRYRSLWACVLLLGVFSLKAAAGGQFEAGTNQHATSKGYGNWFGGYLRSSWGSATNTWSAEMVHQKAFHDRGSYFAAGNTHHFGKRWYTDVTLGSSAGGFIFPRYRVDAFVNRKWLRKQNLVTTAGAGYYKAKDAHRDGSLFLGAIYYFDSPWIVQAGIRYNNSNPGAVQSTSQFVAVTQGRNHKQYLTARYGFGREAYQLLGRAAVISDFGSQSVSLAWKKWLGDGWGLQLRGEHYSNPHYRRVGLESGFFKEF